MLSRVRHIHFIGIGGIGMSGLAAILLKRGFKVSGSDLKPNRLTEGIKKSGGEIFIGHRPSNISEGTELVVYSSSIDEKNPEIVRAKERNLEIRHRSGILAELFNPKLGIAITGAHGKTTTTALAALLLTEARFDPTVVVGGEVDFLGGNWRDGRSDFVICEADESDGTFLRLMPKYAILTNIDEEHLDYYKNIGEIVEANRAFIRNIKDNGCLITSYDDINIKKILKNYPECSNFSRISSGSRSDTSLSNFIRDRKKILTYSRFPNNGADIYPRAIKMNELQSSFEAIFKGKSLGLFQLNIPGMHNIENALAVILLGLELGIDIEKIKKALSSYKGALRRFQVKGIIDDIMVIEDYAHHPREISATVSACRNWPGRRLVGIFQPHRYTRTKFLKEEFGKSFLELDELLLTDIYSASEKPIEGVSTKIIYEEVIKNGQKNTRLIKRYKILPYLLKTLKAKDTVLILGAGDIGELSDELVKGLRDIRHKDWRIRHE